MNKRKCFKISTNLHPVPSSELQILTYLNSRMNLTARDQSRLESLTKGFEGELKFYYLLKEYVSSNSINLFDLRLERNGSEFQIDSLLLFQKQAFLIEVKNFDGDYFISEGKWCLNSTKMEIQNPLQQLERCKILLGETFHRLGIQLQIEPFLIFINPEFTLYNAPKNKRVVFASQLHRFIHMLNNTHSVLTREHREIKDKLVRRHIVQSSRERVPKFDYSKLRKGIVCRYCGGFMVEGTYKLMRCNICKKEEFITDVILRTAYEFSLLFPDRKITLNAIYEWCGTSLSKKIIRKALAENLNTEGAGRGTYYIFRDDYQALNLKQNWMHINNERSLLRYYFS